MSQTDLDLSQNSALTSLVPSPSFLCPLCSEVNNAPLTGLVEDEILARAQVSSAQALGLPCPAPPVVLFWALRQLGGLISVASFLLGLAWGPSSHLLSLPPARGRFWQHLP